MSLITTVQMLYPYTFPVKNPVTYTITVIGVYWRKQIA